MENRKVDQKQLTIGYLVSEYPAVSHTFILREINVLRKLGVQVHTASINRPKVHFEREEESRTYYIKSQGAVACFGALLKRLCTQPCKLLRSILRTLSLGVKSRFFYQFFYWAEALLLADWIEKNKISHLHVHFINPASTVALIASEIVPISLSFTVHGPDSFNECTRNFFFEKIAAAKFVICISDFAKSQVMKLTSSGDWNKLNVIRLGVDIDFYSPKVFRRDPERIELLCVGRLTPQKGQHLIIEAMDLIKENYGRNHAHRR